MGKKKKKNQNASLKCKEKGTVWFSEENTDDKKLYEQQTSWLYNVY